MKTKFQMGCYYASSLILIGCVGVKSFLSSETLIDKATDIIEPLAISLSCIFIIYMFYVIATIVEGID